MRTKIIILCLLFGVNMQSQENSISEKYYDDKNYFTLDANFINTVKVFLIQSKKNVLEKEKESFIKHSVKNDTYLKNLNSDIINSTSHCNGFNEKFAKKIIENRKKKRNVKSVFFINAFLSGDEFTGLDFIIIENFDNTVELYSYGKKKFFFNTDLIDFTNEFMLNLPYSYENKSPSLNGYLTIYKITATGSNLYEANCAVAKEILNYQLQIIKNFYEVN